MFSGFQTISAFGPVRVNKPALEFVPVRDKNRALEFVPVRDKNRALEFGPGRAKKVVLTGSPRNTLALQDLACRLCTTISAPFKGPLNPFPFKDKVFSCISGFRLLLPQTLTIDETYGRNYV